jgi:hypothetical protein
MKRLMLLPLMLALALAACSAVPTQPEETLPPAADDAAVLLPAPADEEPAGNDGTGEERPGVPYAVMDLEALPEAVDAWVKEKAAGDPVALSMDDGDYTYILVSTGAQPTAGYDVEVRSIQDDGTGRYVVTVRATRPDPDQAVADVLTCPTAVVRIDRTDACLCG